MSQIASIGSLRTRRQAIIDEHVNAENEADVERALKTFHEHPHYEMLGNEVDGEEAVRELLTGLFTAIGGFHYHITATHHADEAVILYGNFTGTHTGVYLGIEPTGRKIDAPAMALFDFDGDRLLNETVIFDNDLLRRQMLGQD
jgi:predicted ester cyclase